MARAHAHARSHRSELQGLTRARAGIPFALLVLSALAAGADAACIAAAFDGTVTGSFDRSGTAGRGAGRGTLDGLELGGIIALDAASAPPDSEPSPELGVYASRNAAVIWLALVRLRIGDEPLERPRFRGTVTARDADQHARVSRSGELALLSDLDHQDAATGEYLDYAVALHLRGAPGASDALPASLAEAGYATGWGSATLMYQPPHARMDIHLGVDFRVRSIRALEPGDPAALEACASR